MRATIDMAVAATANPMPILEPGVILLRLVRLPACGIGRAVVVGRMARNKSERMFREDILVFTGAVCSRRNSNERVPAQW